MVYLPARTFTHFNVKDFSCTKQKWKKRNVTTNILTAFVVTTDDYYC